MYEFAYPLMNLKPIKLVSVHDFLGIFLSLQGTMVPWQTFWKGKKAATTKGEKKLWAPALQMKFSHNHLGVRLHLDCFPPPPPPPRTRTSVEIMVSDCTLLQCVK